MWYFDGMRWMTIAWLGLNLYWCSELASLNPSTEEMVAWNKLKGRPNCVEKIPVEKEKVVPEREY